jgi:hypothetical protein
MILTFVIPFALTQFRNFDVIRDTIDYWNTKRTPSEH